VVVDAEEDAPRPDWLDDRAADLWGGLFAVAEVAGGEWPARALEAARSLSAGREGDEEDEVKVAALLDVAAVFQEKGVARLHTVDILAALNVLDERPWPRWHRGNPLSARGLAGLLKGFRTGDDRAPRVRSHQLHLNGRNANGYRLRDLMEPLTRYAPPDYPLHPLRVLIDNDLEPIPHPLQGGGLEDGKGAVSRWGTRGLDDVEDKSPPF
jgi:hypothetical protein